MSGLLLRDVEVDGRRCDVVVDDGRIAANAPTGVGADRQVDVVVDGDGGALIPGLWDHHVHLLALAAATRSVLVGPPSVADRVALRRALGGAPVGPGGWVRATGYDDEVAGPLDRDVLDRLRSDVPVRVQHRSGALWILNGAGCDAIGLHSLRRPGVERDDDDRVTGRWFGGDEVLGRLLGDDAPDLWAVGRALTALGIVGVTDMTPTDDPSHHDLLAGARSRGDLRQHVVVTGGPSLAGHPVPGGLGRGPVKLYLADHALPTFDALVEAVVAARRAGRPVAVHTVTRASLALLLAALETVGPRPGDRIEHGSVIPDELVDSIAEARLTVVTQPGFVADRGDRYLTEVEADDLPHLYRCGSLLAAGVAVAGSSDAPFGPLDPWSAVRAAVSRTTASGVVLGAGERISARRALGLFLGSPDDPGGPSRRVALGAPADLCLLDAPLDEVLGDPSAGRVVTTLVEGVRE